MTDTQQRTAAWFLARSGKLTASNLGAVLGLCNYVSRQQVFDRMRGYEEFRGNDATQWGNDNESNALVEYQIITGNKVDATGLWVHPATPWLAGSPDGLVGEDGMVEIKCPYYFKKGGTRIHTKIPPHYWCQINACLECTGRKWCDYVSWAPEGLVIFRIYRDASAFDYFLSYYGTFYASLHTGQAKPPPLTTKERINIDARMDEVMKDVDYYLWTHAIEQWHAKARPPPPEISDTEEETPSGILLRGADGEPYVKRIKQSA